LSMNSDGTGDLPRERIREAIRGNTVLSTSYLIMNALAAIVASYGLLQDSAAVVIGAMIIAILLGPISGMALALVEGDNRLLSRALAAEAAGAALVFAIAYTLGRVHHDLPLGKEIWSRTSTGILDLAIALAAGAAGAYATLSPRISASPVGVAIATALVPPRCTSAICLSHGLYRAGAGAFMQFLAAPRRTPNSPEEDDHAHRGDGRPRRIPAGSGTSGKVVDAGEVRRSPLGRCCRPRAGGSNGAVGSGGPLREVASLV
jgi:uncharacterized hydrophobic protein (TIGR00271 family)